jgi:hypothetical protein
MKIKVKLFIVISLVLIFLACGNSVNSVQAEAELYEVEKYKVYSDIINSDNNVYAKTIHSEFNDGLFILNVTASGLVARDESPSYLPDDIQSVFPSLKSETVERYKSLNRTRTYLEDKFNLSIDYKMISPYYINSGFYGLGILIDLTNVAFDEFYTQSLVYYGRIHPMGGNGRFFYLEKEENNWIVKDEIWRWASR